MMWKKCSTKMEIISYPEGISGRLNVNYGYISLFRSCRLFLCLLPLRQLRQNNGHEHQHTAQDLPDMPWCRNSQPASTDITDSRLRIRLAMVGLTPFCPTI